MSNSIAYPVFRTPDPDAALSVARQLVEFGVRPYSEVSVEAEVPTLAEVGRLRDALPEAWFRSDTAPFGTGVEPDLARSVRAGELPDDLAGVAEHLPFSVSMLDQPVGSVEAHFAAAVGPHPAEIHWSALEWPPAPERDLRGEYKHAEVTLLLNCDSRELGERAATHLVLVHVRRRNRDGYEERYAQWLAEQFGQQVIGPPQED
ncbi:hypothetical protein [Streptomyces xanthophaeus]|uniref:Uncharacterized protein n=1 Tax=Streptomyces xanthophaeus TaxID=67385 RepID=A0A919GXV6_9ACTN|nr:hypothetical protein [Streptomyces xanthophaeus]GHI86701.1 hypothetical protein Sxan_40650 [Streptomyces xanthophaeus]